LGDIVFTQVEACQSLAQEPTPSWERTDLGHRRLACLAVQILHTGLFVIIIHRTKWTVAFISHSVACRIMPSLL
jgi:hypothetical protein